MSGPGLAELLISLKRDLGVLALRGSEEGEVALTLQEVVIEVEVGAAGSPGSGGSGLPPADTVRDPSLSPHAVQRVRITLKPLEPPDLGS